MRKFTISIILSLILLSLLAGCAAVAETQGTQTITDDLDREISIPASVQKIVSLSPSNTEILYAVGAGSQVIARDDFSNYPQEAVDLPSIGGAQGYNLELITSLQPDLVLAAEINSTEDVKAMEDLGLTVYYMKNPSDLDALYKNLVLIGEITGHKKDAETLAKSLKERVSVVEKAVDDITDRPIVFYELDGSDPAKPWTSGSGTYIDMLLQKAGAVNAAAGMSSAWAQISQEALIVENPDIILLGDSIYGVLPADVAARPGWEQIKAVIENRVYAFNDDLVSRPGPRMVDGLEELFKLIHPDAAAAISSK